MLCQICGKAGASVHFEANESADGKEKDLCSACAKSYLLVVESSLKWTESNYQTSHCVIIQDKSGNEISRTYNPPVPKSDSVPNGLSALASATERLFGSGQEGPGLVVSAKNNGMPLFLSLGRSPGSTRVSIMFTHHHGPEAESSVQHFFASRQIPLAGSIGAVTKYNSRNLFYYLMGSSQEAAEVLKGLLREAYGIGDTDTLTFCFIRA